MSRGEKTTKIHAIVDGLGNPILFHLTGGNIFDSTPVCEILDQISMKGSNILGDKAYGSRTMYEYTTNREATYTIPSSQIRKLLGRWISICIKNAMY
ncbi:transposase [Escherichia sp. SP-MK]